MGAFRGSISEASCHRVLRHRCPGHCSGPWLRACFPLERITHLHAGASLCVLCCLLAQLVGIAAAGLGHAAVLGAGNALQTAAAGMVRAT